MLAALSAHSSASTLRILNWGEYVDPDVISAFEQTHNTQVEYVEFNNTDEFESLFFNRDEVFDVIFPPSNIIGVLKDNNLIQKLDKKQFNHFNNLNPVVMKGLKGQDKKNEFSVPYMWGTTGIGYNATALKKRGIEEADISWSLIFDARLRQKVKDCGIGVVNERDEVFAAALTYLGYSINTSNKEELKSAGSLIKEAVADFTYLHTNQYTDDLKDNKICVGVGYSGDILAQTEENENINYVIPNQGATMWVDVMAIPSNSASSKLAHSFIDYLMSPQASAKNSNYAAYPTPMLDAKPLVDPEILTDPTIYPSSDILAVLEMMAPAARKTNRIKHRLWVKAICSKGKWCAVPMRQYF
jgi:putrescine transport system substrate-binding protein